MNSELAIIFDEVIRVEVPEGLPGTKTALKQVEFALASVRARGGHLIKLIHDEGLGDARVRLRNEIRRLLRVYKKEDRIFLMIRGEDFSMSDSPTRYLADRLPQIELDTDMEKGNENITIVYL